MLGHYRLLKIYTRRTTINTCSTSLESHSKTPILVAASRRSQLCQSTLQRRKILYQKSMFSLNSKLESNLCRAHGLRKKISVGVLDIRRICSNRMTIQWKIMLNQQKNGKRLKSCAHSERMVRITTNGNFLQNNKYVKGIKKIIMNTNFKKCPLTINSLFRFLIGFIGSLKKYSLLFNQRGNYYSDIKFYKMFKCYV